jgi:diaminopimelate epimerase
MSAHTVGFEKYQGTGNDFVIVANGDAVPDPVAFAIAVCDRDTGVASARHGATAPETDRDPVGEKRRGADGVLFLDRREEDSKSGERRRPHVEMRLVQPDGSEAAMCGNGARCAAAWASQRLGVDSLIVDTVAGERAARINDDGTVTVSMGPPRFDPETVPLARQSPLIEESIEGLTVTAVNTGVPHAVAFVDGGGTADAEVGISDVDIESVAPPVRHASVFPEGANVTLAAADGDGFRQRTFERGVEGETRSCGTGAVAIAAVAKRLGRIGSKSVRVTPPGGDLEIRVPDEGDATLTGPVAVEFAGELPVAPDAIVPDNEQQSSET